MVKQYLIIRLKQLYRLLAEAGWIYALITIIAYIFLHLIIYQVLKKSDSNSAYFIAVSLIFIVAGFHYARKDKKFLQMLSHKTWILYFSEYVMASFPILIVFIWVNFVHIPLLIITCLSLISYIPSTEFSLSKKSVYNSFIPSYYFEWIKGYRQYQIPILIFYCIGIIFSFNIFVTPIIILLLNMFIFSFYDTGEPLQFLDLQELPAKKFLKQKLEMHLLFYSKAILPLLIAFLLFHSSYWYVALVIYIGSIFLLTYTILVKYSFYEPNQPNSGQIWSIFGFLSLFIPFLAPLPFLMCFRFYKRAIQNLNVYLHAYN